MTPIVTARSVKKHFGRQEVLRDATFALEPGTVTVLLGVNGAGKTTLLRLLLGTLRPSHGEIRIDGLVPHRQGAAVRRIVGFVPDKPDVPPWMTPRELFHFLAPQYPHWDAGFVNHMGTECELPLDTRFAALSRGQATKALLTSALATRSRLLLLDEPFAPLDPKAREDLLGHLLAHADLERTSALVTTHDLDIAARLADRILVLRNGVLREHGPPVPAGEDGRHVSKAWLRNLFCEPEMQELSS